MSTWYKSAHCGPAVREILYTAPDRWDTDRQRREKRNLTRPAQAKVNMDNAIDKLSLLIAGNFGPNDLFASPTFDDGHLPKTQAEFCKIIDKYIRDLRRAFKRRGKKLVYINAPDFSEGVRFHTHLLIKATDPEDWEEIKSLWVWGDNYVGRIKAADDSDPEAMATYLLKHWRERPNSKKGWRNSQGLNKVEISPARRVQDKHADLVKPLHCTQYKYDQKEREYGFYKYQSYIRTALVLLEAPGQIIQDTAPATGRRRQAARRRGDEHRQQI